MIYNLSYRNHLFLHIILHEGILDIRTARFGVCPAMFEQLHCIKSSPLFSQQCCYLYLRPRNIMCIQIYHGITVAASLDSLQHIYCHHFRFIMRRVPPPFQINYGMCIATILDLFQHKHGSHLRLIMASQSPLFQIYCDTILPPFQIHHGTSSAEISNSCYNSRLYSMVRIQFLII